MSSLTGYDYFDGKDFACPTREGLTEDQFQEQWKSYCRKKGERLSAFMDYFAQEYQITPLQANVLYRSGDFVSGTQQLEGLMRDRLKIIEEFLQAKSYGF